MARIGKTIETLNALKSQWRRSLEGGLDPLGKGGPATAKAGAGGVGATGHGPSGLAASSLAAAGLAAARAGAAGLDAAGFGGFGRAAPEASSALVEVAEFGANPGNLRLFSFVPSITKPAPALVVVLHGCKQTAAGYDLGTGWSSLAEAEGFILCVPEQKRENNPNNCFSWFQAQDIERESGEAASIRSMVEHLAVRHGVDRSKIFVTGLSAGGAMTSVMLAAYPDVFAAGAVIAGLPYRCAVTVQGAFESMARGDSRTPEAAAQAVRDASAHEGPWPRLSVWHGTGDKTVTHDNSGAIVAQWTHLMGVHAGPARQDTVDGQTRRVWTGRDGSEVIEEYVIEGLGHGAPLSAGPGDTQFGAPGPYLLEAGISSTWRIAQFWGLADGTRPARAERPARAAADGEAQTPALSGPQPGPQPGPQAGPQAGPQPGPDPRPQQAGAEPSGVTRGLMDALAPVLKGDAGTTIRDALRKAGLL